MADGEDGFAQAGFVNDDIGVAVFDPPCGFFPSHIKRVQAFWHSDGGPGTQVATHLRVYGSAGPDPGPPIYTAQGGIMNDGFLNEFPVGTLGWVVNEGPFAIGIEYVTDVGQPVDQSSGHLTTDADGCQTGKNLIFDVASGQWFDACALGMSGDFVIRIIFEAMGAGCFGDSDCDGDVDLDDFASFAACYAGADAGVSGECLVFDCDGDGDVDLDDLAAFAACYTATENNCNPSCAVCQSTPSPESGTRSVSPRHEGQPRNLLDGAPPYPPADGDYTDGGFRFTLSERFIVGAILVLVAGIFVGPCIDTACRQTQSASFHAAGETATPQEQTRINQALDWLGNLGDQEGDQAWLWYSAHGAYNAFFGIIKVNHKHLRNRGRTPSRLNSSKGSLYTSCMSRATVGMCGLSGRFSSANGSASTIPVPQRGSFSHN